MRERRRGHAGRGRRAGRRQKKTVAPEGEVKDSADFGHSEARTQAQTVGQQDAYWWEGGDAVPIGETFHVRKLDTPLEKIARSQAGRRSSAKTERKRGRYIKARPSPGDPQDLAFDATFRAAAPHQSERRRQKAEGPALRVGRGDYQKKVRVRKAANLILFVVDASWSMAVAERMAATKGAIMSLLTDAYQRRDRVGLIVFQKDQARLVLPPTSSVDLAQRALKDIPVGGKTPLSAGLTLAHRILVREMQLHPEVAPLMIVLTDGAGNVSMGGAPPQVEAYHMADQIDELDIRSIVINMEHQAFDQGLAAKLAEHLAAPCYSLKDLRAESLYQTVKDELKAG